MQAGICFPLGTEVSSQLIPLWCCSDRPGPGHDWMSSDAPVGADHFVFWFLEDPLEENVSMTEKEPLGCLGIWILDFSPVSVIPFRANQRTES